MRATITIEDELVDKATHLSGIKETSPLVRAALQALIHRESALRLARLGGSEPALKSIPRRRPATL